MEVAKSTRDDGKTQVTVTLSPEEVDEQIDKAFKGFAKTKIPGFRAGKAPRPVIEQNLGGHKLVYAQITARILDDVAPLAIDGQDVIFLGEPVMDDDGPVEDGKEFTFFAYGDVAPQVELDSYEPVEIKMPAEEATEEDLDIQLKALQDYYYNFETVDRAAEAGDFVMVKLDTTSGGTEVPDLTNESRLVEIGGSAMPKELTDELIGMKAGDTKEFDFKTDYDVLLIDKDLHCKATVKEVRVKEIPELDDELAKKVGFDTFDEMCEKLKEEITEKKKEQLPRLKESRCVKALAKRIKGDVPDIYVDTCREHILREFFNSLQEQGATFDQFMASRGITSEQFKEDLDEQSKEEAEECLALDALFRELGLEITEEDIKREFSVTSNPEATRKAWEDAGQMSIIREAIRRQKATKWLVDNAKVTITAGKDD